MSSLDPFHPEFTTPPAPRSNALGLTGFVLSIVGLVTCGCLAPVALVFSLIGVFRQPRGFAIAGLVISGVGLLLLAGVAVFAVSGGMSLVPTLKDGYGFASEIEAYRQSHNGAAPKSWGELPNMPAGGPLDHWGNPYHYSVDRSRVEILSDGPDGVAGNGDDVHMVIDDRGNVRAYVGRPPSFMR